jgi:fructosamine-3-kinase
VRAALAAALGEDVAELVPVAGGSLNDAYRATLAGGARVFVKTARDAVPGAYTAEAAGLRWLAEPGALPVPEVLAVDERFLALAWVDGGGRADMAALGRGLAAMHRAGAAAPGAQPPGIDGPLRLGPLALPNAPGPSWPAFYAANRLLPLAAMAADRGALDAAGVRAVEAVAARIEDLAGPDEPVARLHGDLWSGNVHAGADGRPWLIDPAAYGGHREVDLAMLELFGAPGPAFFAAYDEVWPRAAGHDERVALWQLFPLLVHAVLFGGSYGATAAGAAARYV